jgi:hypothetical protein
MLQMGDIIILLLAQWMTPRKEIKIDTLVLYYDERMVLHLMSAIWMRPTLNECTLIIKQNVYNSFQHQIRKRKITQGHPKVAKGAYYFFYRSCSGAYDFRMHPSEDACSS